MSKYVGTLLRPVFGMALLVLVAVSGAGGGAVSAQSALAGEWTASVDKEESDKIHLSLMRGTERGRRSNMGMSFDFADLRGLSREQVTRGGPVKFALSREAGTVEFEGSFQGGKGSGTFRFTGNQGFVSAMKGRGFDFEQDAPAADDRDEPENRLFAATVLNVTTAQADDLLSAGFNRLEVGDLFKAAIFKVDSKFAREMKAAGFPDLGMEDLVKARIFKVDAAFVGEVARMGFSREPMENLVKLRIFKIDADFIRRAKAAGVPLEVEKLVERRIGVRGRLE